MKAISKLLLVACVAAVIYFATIGRSDFYRLLDTINEVIEAIGHNYLKK